MVGCVNLRLPLPSRLHESRAWLPMRRFACESFPTFPANFSYNGCSNVWNHNALLTPAALWKHTAGRHRLSHMYASRSRSLILFTRASQDSLPFLRNEGGGASRARAPALRSMNTCTVCTFVSVTGYFGHHRKCT